MQVPSFCPPSGVNGSASAVARKALPGQGAGTPRLSNLDLNGRHVRKGCKVSYHGVRGVVAKVSRGRCCVEYMHFTGRSTGSYEWLVCESVQVVA